MTALRRYMVIVARAERIHRHNLARAKTPEQIEKLNNAREIRTIWGERAANLTPEEREYLAREAQVAIAVQRMRPPPAPKPVGAPGTEHVRGAEAVAMRAEPCSLRNGGRGRRAPGVPHKNCKRFCVKCSNI